MEGQSGGSNQNNNKGRRRWWWWKRKVELEIRVTWGKGTYQECRTWAWKGPPHPESGKCGAPPSSAATEAQFRGKGTTSAPEGEEYDDEGSSRRPPAVPPSDSHCHCRRRRRQQSRRRWWAVGRRIDVGRGGLDSLGCRRWWWGGRVWWEGCSGERAARQGPRPGAPWMSGTDERGKAPLIVIIIMTIG